MSRSKGAAARRPRTAREKILSQKAAREHLSVAQGNGQTVVFTNGCFDLLHAGHVRCLEEARGLGDLLVVALNTDASVRRLKGDARPLVPLARRMEVIAGLECVDVVVSFGHDTPIPLLRLLRPDVLAKGGDYATSGIVGHELVTGWGGRVARLREHPGLHTTLLIEKMKQ